MKRISLAILAMLSLPYSLLCGQDSAQISSRIETWFTKAHRSAPGTWGIVVADRTGRVLWSRNADTPLIPASTVKVLTTGFARTRVGGEARRATRVIGAGQIDLTTGTWQGPWALELNGDVTLERSSRSGTSLLDLAEQLTMIGIRKLTGPLQITSSSGDPNARFPSVWELRHRGQTYAPLVGEVTLNENLISLTIAPGERVGQPARVVGSAPAGLEALVTVTARTVAGRANTGLRLQARADGGYQVSGTIGTQARARGFTATASNPVKVLEAAWAYAAAAVGIEWNREVAAVPISLAGVRRTLAEVVSASFDSVAHEINTRSLNLGAELLLSWGARENAADQLNQHVGKVTGLAPNLYHLVDGSGLSGSDRVAPIVFTTYLARIAAIPGMENFPLLLPANGSGTLRSLAKGLPDSGVVRGKTGSLTNVSTLIGYLGRAEGPLVIAAMYNGTSSGNARAMQWDLFRTLGADGAVLALDPAETTGQGGQSLDGTRFQSR